MHIAKNPYIYKQILYISNAFHVSPLGNLPKQYFQELRSNLYLSAPQIGTAPWISLDSQQITHFEKEIT